MGVAWLTPLFFTNYSQNLMPTSLHGFVVSPVLVQALVAMASGGGFADGLVRAGKACSQQVQGHAVRIGHHADGRRPAPLQRQNSTWWRCCSFYSISKQSSCIPWVVVYRELKMFAFVEMLVFVIMTLSGFFYIWKKGALDWAEPGPLPNGSLYKRFRNATPTICESIPWPRPVDAFDARRGDCRQVRPEGTDARNASGPGS